MSNFYQTKRDFHHKQWELAFNTDKPIAAAQHMKEYLNYQEMYEMQEKTPQADVNK